MRSRDERGRKRSEKEWEEVEKRGEGGREKGKTEKMVDGGEERVKREKYEGE